ncbi:P-loop containing nucleoside triphosphate hydrolase protein [Infundibulicybe gibba]|nr:P-loop containing nucleoside triphosphate hydrolase protein [Infundibulicybe gibba]
MNNSSVDTPAQNDATDIVTIVVIGRPGSGKTEFINCASGSELPVGHGPRPCTQAMQMGQRFELDGRQVVLIDTPGFDYTELGEGDVLNLIKKFLKLNFGKGKILSGVIYLHRIHDNTWASLSVRTFRLYQKLCGECGSKNTIILTNFWGEVPEAIGKAREDELRNKNWFFRPAIMKGAAFGRHINTTESAHAALRHLVDNLA